MMTNLTNLQNHINKLNEGRENFMLADAEHFFSLYGISTVEAFEEHMDMETFSDWYKEENGFRPRGYTVTEAREWMERELQEMDRMARAKADEEERLAEARESVKPENRPANSVMADALKGWRG
jgi:hypothetical protein